MDMDESYQVSIILGRLFLVIAGAVIDVQADTMAFQLYEERVDFYFPPPTQPSVLIVHPVPITLYFPSLLQLLSRSRCLMGMEDLT